MAFGLIISILDYYNAIIYMRIVFISGFSFKQNIRNGVKHYARWKYFPVAANFSQWMFQGNPGSGLDSETDFH